MPKHYIRNPLQSQESGQVKAGNSGIKAREKHGKMHKTTGTGARWRRSAKLDEIMLATWGKVYYNRKKKRFLEGTV
jgi:hypothetical protein